MLALRRTLLLGLNGVIAAVLWLNLAPHPDSITTAAIPPNVATSISNPPDTITPTSTSFETASLQLFRPPTVSKSTASTAELTISFRVLGIVLGGTTPVAIIQRTAEAPLERVRSGMLIDGWEIVQIERKDVVLKRNGQSLTLQLDPQNH